jgi:hypothetical protein
MALDEKHLLGVACNDPLDGLADAVKFRYFFFAQETFAKTKAHGINLDPRHRIPQTRLRAEILDPIALLRLHQRRGGQPVLDVFVIGFRRGDVGPRQDNGRCHRTGCNRQSKAGVAQPLPAALTLVAKPAAQGLAVFAHAFAQGLALPIGQAVQLKRTAVGIDAPFQRARREIICRALILQQVAQGKLIATHRQIVGAVAAIAILVTVALAAGPVARSNARPDFLPVAGKHLAQLALLAIIETFDRQQPAGRLNALAQVTVGQVGGLPVVANHLLDLRRHINVLHRHTGAGGNARIKLGLVGFQLLAQLTALTARRLVVGSQFFRRTDALAQVSVSQFRGGTVIAQHAVCGKLRLGIFLDCLLRLARSGVLFSRCRCLLLLGGPAEPVAGACSCWAGCRLFGCGLLFTGLLFLAFLFYGLFGLLLGRCRRLFLLGRFGLLFSSLLAPVPAGQVQPAARCCRGLFLLGGFGLLFSSLPAPVPAGQVQPAARWLVAPAPAVQVRPAARWLVAPAPAGQVACCSLAVGACSAAGSACCFCCRVPQ